MSFIGIDISNTTIHCSRFIYKHPQSFSFDSITFDNSTAIPFSLLYDLYKGPMIVDTTPEGAFQTNYFPSLSYFMLKNQQEILEESRAKNYRYKIKHGREESSGKEYPLFTVNIQNTLVDKTVNEIMTDYFNYLLANVIQKGDKSVQGPYYAVVTLSKQFKQFSQKIIAAGLYNSGFKSVKFVPNDTAGFLGGINLQPLTIEDNSVFLLVNFGRNELYLSLVRYKDKDFEVMEKEYNRNIGGNKIDESIKELFLEQINEQDPFALDTNTHFLDTMSQEAKVFFSNTADKQAFFKKSFNEILLQLDKETYEEIFLKQVVETFKKLVLAFHKYVNKKYALDSIVCVGGTSNIQQFQRLLEIIFNKRVICLESPEIALARGAAFLSAKYFSVFRLRQFNSINDAHSFKTTPYSLGIATANELLDFTVMHFMVPKGTAIPFDIPKVVILKSGSQANFKVTLLEGDCIVSKQNKMLHQFDISLDQISKEVQQDLKIELLIEEDFIITFRVKVDNREFFQKFKHIPDTYFFEKIQPKELESEKVRKRTVRAKIAEIIKRVETKYRNFSNVQLKKRMEHIYQKACDYKVYAKETKFDLQYLITKLNELEKL